MLGEREREQMKMGRGDSRILVLGGMGRVRGGEFGGIWGSGSVAREECGGGWEWGRRIMGRGGGRGGRGVSKENCNSISGRLSAASPNFSMQNSDRFEPNKILDDICCAEELCVMVCDGVCVYFSLLATPRYHLYLCSLGFFWSCESSLLSIELI